jgi:hypothetical protein
MVLPRSTFHPGRSNSSSSLAPPSYINGKLRRIPAVPSRALGMLGGECLSNRISIQLKDQLTVREGGESGLRDFMIAARKCDNSIGGRSPHRSIAYCGSMTTRNRVPMVVSAQRMARPVSGSIVTLESNLTRAFHPRVIFETSLADGYPARFGLLRHGQRNRQDSILHFRADLPLIDFVGQ